MSFPTGFHNKFNIFFTELKSRIESEHDTTFPLLKGGTTMEYEFGRRYVKLIRVSGGQRSCYGFVDGNGDIYKAASWKAPAKHVRGNIHSEDGGQGCCGQYGVAYLK